MSMSMSMASSKLLLACFSLFLSLSTVSVTSQQLLPLTHSLSKTQFSSAHHLLKSTATISAARHRRHTNRKRVSLPLSPGSDYTLTFTLKSQTFSVYMDTGSDMVWFPCSPFECILCEGKYPPGSLSPLNVSKSSLLSCKSHACSSAHSSLSSSNLCAIAKCPLDEIEISDCSNFSCPSFYYAYGDGSLIAELHSETLLMPSTSNSKPLNLKNFTFGCAHSTLGEPIGVAGFGRGSLSLPAQLANLSPDLGNQFSYCLVSHSFDSTKLRHPSPLILGKYKETEIDQVSEYVYTPMLENPKHPYFYSVGLEAISVGSRRIEAPENLRRVDRQGNGGVVVDSGTTYTMLPSKLYKAVAVELERRIGKVLKRATETESMTGLRPCFYMHGRKGRLGVVIPSLALHFGRNSSVVLPRRNYFHEFMDGGDDKKKKSKGRKMGCLMMMDAGEEEEEESGPGATLGNYQQQGFEVVYDLAERRVGFARRECATLWNNLNQH
ncbi:probable aspartyl protease At4g16563 [Chenopodium quinoa]|uniref:Peptidase A1 domain-containing protein n=1 Tax=Chenopodium quinoa TaxID=63459 RepID=A0A803L6M2_CHEQI|nr:probable aspartyl protease At4g16563 [Chenopodium quinoa]